MLKLVWPVFILLIVAQWLVPGEMIWHNKNILRYGVPHKFRMAPVDPNDPFRGSYITLDFKENRFTTANKNLTKAATIYVTFFTGKNGFAYISNVSVSKPSAADHYVKTTIWYVSDQSGTDSSTIFIRYPFEKFYLNEYKAPEAERMYNQSRRDSAQNAYALVYILNGDAVVKDVFINDTSILQILHKNAVVR